MAAGGRDLVFGPRLGAAFAALDLRGFCGDPHELGATVSASELRVGRLVRVVVWVALGVDEVFVVML